jgi:hypothetical protein
MNELLVLLKSLRLLRFGLKSCWNFQKNNF